jgi:hypothetical protein
MVNDDFSYFNKDEVDDFNFAMGYVMEVHEELQRRK